MSKYCANCGNELLETDKFCPKCGTATGVAPTQIGEMQLPQTDGVQQIIVEQDPKKYISPEDNKKANKLTLVSLFLMIGVTLILAGIEILLDVTEITITQGFLSLLSSVSEIIGFGLLIYIRIVYPKNVFSKVIIILAIVLIVISIIMVVAFYIACGAFLYGCASGL